ncbi:hypothetical protein OG762_31020 [Streptomyces sp. NBC_01136]|uniref:hypothetical protein n=1 Tax=unclassified Streptomyces TaxID=2593676 RepID=UPI0032510FD4|nr:hypothetical protein OG762_31020 [Streptomyces sp. NBC_01136]
MANFVKQARRPIAGLGSAFCVSGVLRYPNPIRDGPSRPSKVAVRREDVLAVMATDPHRPWHAREIAAALNTVKQSTLALHLSAWACKNLLVKTAPATFRLPEQPVIAAPAKPLAATNTPTTRAA